MQLGGIGELQQSLHQDSIEQSHQQEFEQQLRGFQGIMDDIPGIVDQTGEMADDEHAALREAAEGLEGLFVNMLVKQMRSTVPDNKLLDGGHGGKMFREKLDQKYSNLIARQKNFGIAGAIYDQFVGQIAPAEI